MKPKYKNYTSGSMSFASGFLGPRGDVGFMMNADWEKAQKIINNILKKRSDVEYVEMGLDGDWNENSMTVWENGEFTKYDCYDASQWAEPLLIVNYKDGSNEAYDCWFRQLDVTAETVEETKLLN
jgi:hypothetical protein